MKWVERRIRTDLLAEQMIRVYLDINGPSGPLDHLRYRFIAEMENGLFLAPMGPDHELEGFICWWRLNDQELYNAVKESDDVFPPGNGLARQEKPRWVYVSALCAKNGLTIKYLMRTMRAYNQDCELSQFIRWRKGRFLEGTG
jgi:hypothetical protein